MTAYNQAGAATYYAFKAYEISQAYDTYQQVKDSPQATDAMLDVLTKTAELAAIGVPTWYAEKVFAKTNLDRIFDEHRQTNLESLIQ